MTFRFIHTADWQLGKPFANFPADLAGELSAARFAAIGRIAEIAGTRGARHVCVAGDVFDGEDLPNAILRRALERMAEHTSITWVLLPGNHDPARPGGIWDRIHRLDLPANVKPVLTNDVMELTDGVFVLPSPLTSKNPGRDPTQWMDTAATPEGALRLGLAHGSVQGFGSDGESSVLIARDRAAAAGLAYLALGDWHGVTRVAADTWYSGTPEPDRHPNNEPGYVLDVAVEAAGAVSVDRVASGQFTWSKMAAALRSVSDLVTLEPALVKPGTLAGRVLLRLSLNGSLSLSEHAELDAWIERWSARLCHLDVDRSAVATRPTSADFDSLGQDGPLLDAARILAATAADAAHPDHTNAPLALKRLFGFAAEAARDGAA
jgi:Calcineurin-like phosphoesterase